MKRVGRFLERGSFSTSTGGQDLRNYDAHPGDLVISSELPDNGVYEVEMRYSSSCEVCNITPLRLRRIDMRYLTKRQRGSVIDISPKFSEEIEKFEERLEKILKSA